MNQLQAEHFQQLLEEACDRHIESGGRIISRRFTSYEDGGQCPLTCLLGRQTMYYKALEANRLLNTHTISDEELWALVFAFDGKFVPDHQDFVSAKLIGKALRHKYIQESST